MATEPETFECFGRAAFRAQLFESSIITLLITTRTVIGDPFKGLILSQMLLSVQLPITVFTQVYLTSSKKVMGVYANSRSTTIILLLLGTMVTVLNIALLISLF